MTDRPRVARNESNVEALARLIAQAQDIFGMSPDPEHPWVKGPIVTPEQARTIAEQIADRGVLVPSALSDEQARDLRRLSRVLPHETADDVRADLTRIAREG